MVKDCTTEVRPQLLLEFLLNAVEQKNRVLINGWVPSNIGPHL